MYLYCAKCHTQHPASGRCPKCSSRLLSPGEAADVLVRAPVRSRDAIPTTFTRRVIVGSVVALGLHLAFREWATALATALGQSADIAGGWLNFALRLTGAAVGGVLAGAGRPRAYLGGLLVGAVSGVAWLVVDAYPDPSLDPDRLAAAAALAGAGGLVALIGGRVWPAPRDLPVPESPRASSLLKLKPGEGRVSKGRPTSWVRLVVGVTVAVCGLMAADAARDRLTKLPKGLLQVGGAGPVGAQIGGAMLLLGGMVAGASTGAGVRHGLLAGLAAGLAVVGLTALPPDGPPPAVQYVIERLGVADNPRGGAGAAAAAALAAVTLGGWLGGSLFPPLVKRNRLGLSH